VCSRTTPTDGSSSTQRMVAMRVGSGLGQVAAGECRGPAGCRSRFADARSIPANITTSGTLGGRQGDAGTSRVPGRITSSMRGAPTRLRTVRTMFSSLVAVVGLLLSWQLHAAEPACSADRVATVGAATLRIEVDARAGTGPIVRTPASVALQRDPHNRAPFSVRAPATPALPRFCAHLARSRPTGGATRRYRRYFLYLPTAPPRSS